MILFYKNFLQKTIIIYLFLISNILFAHSLPSHFKEHNHAEIKFERPNIRLEKEDSINQ